SNDCSHLKLAASNLSNLYIRSCTDIEKRITPKGEDPPRPTHGIHSLDFFRTNTFIENEEDLERYLADIRVKLREILKDKNIEVI
ncbi:MAG: hypothetical protein GX268_07175, partial [Methanomicrobiales archaeon]|nr:hypothetical protein [Methanomicrobiales archaeon]